MTAAQARVGSEGMHPLQRGIAIFAIVRRTIEAYIRATAHRSRCGPSLNWRIRKMIAFKRIAFANMVSFALLATLLIVAN